MNTPNSQIPSKPALGNAIALGLILGLMSAGGYLLYAAARGIWIPLDCAELSVQECVFERELAVGLAWRQLATGGALLFLALGIALLSKNLQRTQTT